VPLRPGDSILCLYDSTEGSSAASNPLSGEFARAVREMALDVTFHDVAKGLPPAGAVAGARAVATGFLDGSMDRAAAWPDFVRNVVDSGTRYVIVGNYGAWQERSGGAFVETSVVNRAFAALGVRYEADWTDDPARLAIEVLDPSLGKRDALAPERVRHYYRFTPERPDVRVLVSSTRKDRPGAGGSAVVFTGATGAMALSKHLSPRDLLDSKADLALDLGAFANAALGRVPRKPGTLLVLHDPASPDATRAMRALAAVSSYSGIAMEAVTVDDARALRPADLASRGGIVLAVPEVRRPLDAFLAGLLRDHLSRGGRVLALLPLRNVPLASVIAATPQDGPPAAAPTAGIRFREGAFPGLDGMVIEPVGDAVRLSALRPSLSARCAVLAESAPGPGGGDPVPLWWRCPAGSGAAIALNAFEFPDRATLGVVLQAVLDVQGGWAMPVLGAALEFVDDCPLPMTGQAHPAMGKPDTEFYRADVYGMLREAVRTLRMRPVFLGVFSYDDRVAPPFEEPFGGATGGAARDLGARIVADDMQVGLHGANHMSPGLDGGVTKRFPDRPALAAWFRAGRASFAAVFGDLERPRVFVPPNDWIDAAGKQALAAEVPEVRVLASVFAGTDVEAEQDFAPDPDVRGLTDVPRTWAGYALAGEARLGMVNGVLLYGVSSHFIHPDDVMDPERSGGLDWARLRSGFLAGAAEVRNRFPFLRDMEVTEAAEAIDRLYDLRWRVVAVPGGGMEVVRTAGAGGPVPAFVKTRPGCAPSVEGGSVVVADPASGLHVVRMDGRVMRVGCADGHRREP
jgi:hypothetical protein